MAKKKFEEPVYVKAPLKITREQFTELLNEQIEKGKGLLKIEVQQVPTRAMSYGEFGYGVRRQRKGVEYVEDSKDAFMSEYKIWNDYNNEIYQSSFTDPNNTYWHKYESEAWDHFYSQDIVADYKKQILRQITQMQSDIQKVALIECIAAVEVQPQPKMIASMDSDELSKDIFIVHGHNEEMKQTVARVVSKLGLNPIILHEQANGGKTIIEKFENNAEHINFAIILLSEDDLGASARDLYGVKDEDVRQHLEKRARQNVVFEMGYFAGKLGRANVLFLLQTGVSKPGDLDGIVYTSYDAVHAWRFELVKELKNAGYKVSADKLL